VVLALDLLEAVAHAVEKALVGGDDMPAEVELDHRGGAQQRVDHALVFARGFDGTGQVGGAQGVVVQCVIRALDRLPDRTQPGFLAVGPQQSVGTAEMLGTLHGGLEACVVRFGTKLLAEEVVDGAADEVVAAITHFAEEQLVGVLNASLRVQFQDHHLPVQRVLDLQIDCGFLAQFSQFSFQVLVEHLLASSEGQGRPVT